MNTAIATSQEGIYLSPMNLGIIVLVMALLYIEAGRRYFQIMFLTMPDFATSKDPLVVAVRTNTVPWWFKAIFVVVWPLVLLVAWASAKILVLTAAAPRRAD